MIHQYQYLGCYRAVCVFQDRAICAVAPTPHEAWQWLIELIAIEARP